MQAAASAALNRRSDFFESQNQLRCFRRSLECTEERTAASCPPLICRMERSRPQPQCACSQRQEKPPPEWNQHLAK
jgi:hypothetical protein